MKTDSLKIENLLPIIETTKGLDKIWLYCIIGIIILLFCLFFGLWTYFHSERFYLKRRLRQAKEEPDFKNIMDSAFGAKNLYDKLKGKCHPDNFSTNLILFDRATEIFALIVKNKYNYRELILLKERAEKELNINI